LSQLKDHAIEVHSSLRLACGLFPAHRGVIEFSGRACIFSDDLKPAAFADDKKAARRTMKSSKYLIYLAAALVAGLYAAGSWSNQFVYDDHEVIENQFPVYHLNDLGRIFAEPHYLNFPYYRPITRATFAMQRTFCGLDPRPYHLFNALLAGAIVLAAYALLRRPALGLTAFTAAVAATWFGLHPAVSECVFPAASGRETLVPAFLIILTVCAYLGSGWRWFAIAMFLFACALLSKEQAAVLPGIFLLADLLQLTPGPRNVHGAATKYSVIVTIFGFYFFLRHLIFHESTVHFTFLQHPLEPLTSLLYGIQTAVTPFMALHYEPPFDSWFDGRLAAVSCAIVLILIIAVANRRRKIGRAAIFWLGWFMLLQLPTAHLIEQEAAYSERYVALAVLAFPAAVMTVLAAAAPSRLRTAAATAVGIWMLIAGTVTYFRGAYYTDDASFCLQWENTNPHAAGPHDGFGRIAQEREEYSTAVSEYQTALTIQPNDATAHNNLANLLADRGDFSGASQHYEWLLSHPSFGADQAATMTNYAQLLGQEAFNRRDSTMRDRAHGLLDAAIQIKPDYAQAHYILGEWNEAFGSPDAAIRQYNIALHLKPDWPEVQKRLQSVRGSSTRP
jgi:tetratricopeptide (TPR) repeat protein